MSSLSKINDGDGGDGENDNETWNIYWELKFISGTSQSTLNLLHLILKTLQNLNVHKRTWVTYKLWRFYYVTEPGFELRSAESRAGAIRPGGGWADG